MNIFGVGLPEIAVIAGLALVIFGPKRLPELGRTIGKTLKGLQSASTEFEREIKNAMTEDESSNENIVDNSGVVPPLNTNQNNIEVEGDTEINN